VFSSLVDLLAAATGPTPANLVIHTQQGEEVRRRADRNLVGDAQEVVVAGDEQRFMGCGQSDQVVVAGIR
jgi:hypothetical protein